MFQGHMLLEEVLAGTGRFPSYPTCITLPARMPPLPQATEIYTEQSRDIAKVPGGHNDFSPEAVQRLGSTSFLPI